MPTYEFINKKTKKLVEVVVKISDYDQFKRDNPHLERYFGTAPGFSFDGKAYVAGGVNTDDTFKEVLAKIGEAHPNSPLAATHGRPKTIKQAQSDRAVGKALIKAKEGIATKKRRDKW
jgi:hypothetical protein